jgi:hypothetical protein
MYEISNRMNQREDLLKFLWWLANNQIEMVGFNNIGFDYFFIHELMTNPYTFTYQKAFEICQSIIESNDRGFRNIQLSDRLTPQIDLMKICHFDNNNKRTSLKALQFAMRSESVEDLPFVPGIDLNDQEKDLLKKYNVHDVTETEKFLIKNEHHIEMRREYLTTGVLRGDVLNYSDVKIGTEYLVSRIGRNNCYTGGKPKQSIRDLIEFNKIILPKIYYRTELFNEVLEWFKTQKIYINGEYKPSLEKSLAGLNFQFGMGGIHASADNKIFESTDTHAIIDVDVAGMYVAVAIANRFAPEHLGQAYVDAYRQIKDDRARYPKGSSQNKAIKLAGNGAYGNSNNPFSPFYDPKYTFSVTVNGQLQLLQLVEMISLIPDCELIQANTDGITVFINKNYIPFFNLWCREWEQMTGLVLEEVKYKRMWIRDVNNYIAEKMNGELKRKGAYNYPIKASDYDDCWNKDYSNIASQIAAEQAMINSWPIYMALRLITDPFDFMLRYKTTKGSKVFIGDKEQLKTVRYYVSTVGESMKKISPPKGEIGQFKRKNSLTDKFFNEVMKEIGKDKWDSRIHTGNKSKYDIAETSIQSGFKVKQCNNAKDFNWQDVDWNYYVKEAEKILIGRCHV